MARVLCRFLDQMDENPAQVRWLFQPEAHMGGPAAVFVTQTWDRKAGSGPYDTVGSVRPRLSPSNPTTKPSAASGDSGL